MIAHLSGKCVHADSDSLILDVNGVGYLVKATVGVIAAATKNPNNLSLWIHTNVREDAIQLYGFLSRLEQLVFERLVQLHGVGPKVALGILSAFDPSSIRRAADHEDIAFFQSVPGIGPKVARRIVTELKGKLDDIVPSGLSLKASVRGETDAQLNDSFYDAREALVGLGLSVSDAEQALASTDEKATASERVKQALKAKAVTS